MSEPSKSEILMACQQKVEERIAMLETRLASVREARNQETKSSMGDKYETTRTMMQLEEDKLLGQLSEVQKMQQSLDYIQQNPNTSDRIGLGNLVHTTKGTFFLAIGLGRLKVGDTMIFVVSKESPVGKKLWNLREGDDLDLPAGRVKIEAII